MGYQGIGEENFRKIIPVDEIQKYEGNCWATSLSMMMRCHGFNISQKYVTDLLFEWRFKGVTSEQMAQLIGYFNKNFLLKKGWTMKDTPAWKPMLAYLGNMAPVQVFITGHFLLVLGYDDEKVLITYFDPWLGDIRSVSPVTFTGFGGGETVYMFKE